jgi:hypothetical protein
MVSINHASPSEAAHSTTEIVTISSVCENVNTLSSHHNNHIHNVFIEVKTINSKTVKSVALKANKSTILSVILVATEGV